MSRGLGDVYKRQPLLAWSAPRWRAHFARHRGALQANSGVPGLDREESRPLPGAGEPYSYGGVPAGAFLLGVACGVVLLALTRRPRRVRFRN